MTTAPLPLTTIPNIGPATAAAFEKAGIQSAQELRAMGADAAYVRLLQAGTAPHFIFYYVIVMGLQGRPWNDCKGAEKAALRVRFDALKAQHAAPARSERDAALDFLGVVARKQP